MRGISNIATAGSGGGGGTTKSTLYYASNNSTYSGYYVRATGTVNPSLVYTTTLGSDGNAYQQVEGMEYYMLEFYYMSSESEVILLTTYVEANMGCIAYVPLVGYKVFTEGTDYMQPGYTMYSKVASGTGSATFTSGNIQLVRSASNPNLAAFIPFVKQPGMQSIQFRWSFTYQNSNYRQCNLLLGVAANDTAIDTTSVSYAYLRSNANMDTQNRVVNGTSLTSLQDGNTYYIKMILSLASPGYSVTMNIHDIWFE